MMHLQMMHPSEINWYNYTFIKIGYSVSIIFLALLNILDATDKYLTGLIDNMIVYLVAHPLKEKTESFWPKKLSHWSLAGGTKIRPRILSDWRIFLNWLWLDIKSQIWILSQIDSILRVNFEFLVKLTWY